MNSLTSPAVPGTSEQDRAERIARLRESAYRIRRCGALVNGLLTLT